MSLRNELAVLLAKVSTRLVVPRDDRVVVLNTNRDRVVPGKPGAGELRPFITCGRRTAQMFPPDWPGLSAMGTPVPAIVAKLAGYKTRGMDE